MKRSRFRKASSWGMPQLDRGDPFIAEVAVGFLALIV